LTALPLSTCFFPTATSNARATTTRAQKRHAQPHRHPPHSRPPRSSCPWPHTESPHPAPSRSALPPPAAELEGIVPSVAAKGRGFGHVPLLPRQQSRAWLSHRASECHGRRRPRASQFPLTNQAHPPSVGPLPRAGHPQYLLGPRLPVSIRTAATNSAALPPPCAAPPQRLPGPTPPASPQILTSLEQVHAG
jgi:hypothetical protein